MFWNIIRLMERGCKSFTLFIFFLIAVLHGYAQMNWESSRSKAIKLATRRGYYMKKEPWLSPTVILDTVSNTWQIRSRMVMHIRTGKCHLNQPEKDVCNCRYTNGCTEIFTKEMSIDASNHRILSKRQTRERFPNYE
jgi:hypothetical protein